MKFMFFVKKLGILGILLLLVIFFSIASPAFLTVQNFINVIRQVSMLAIVGVGFTFVLIGQGIDLSVGSQISLIGVVTALLIRDAAMSPALAVAIGVAMGAVIGFINGILVTKMRINPLIATLAMLTILKGVSYIACGGMPVYNMPSSLKAIAQGYVWVIPIPVIIMVVIVLVGGFLLNKTYFGVEVYAVGSNLEAARLSGLNTDRIKITVYALLGLLTGIAAIIMLARINSGQPVAGTGFELDVLTAIVLGGVSISGGEGKISGAFVGVLVMGVLSNGLLLVGLGEYYQMLVKGLVLLTAVGIDGLQHKRSAASKAAAAA